MYAQAIYPVDNYNIFFTYQDSARINLLRQHGFAHKHAANAYYPVDYEAFMQRLSNYPQTTSAAFNAEAPDRLRPR